MAAVAAAAAPTSSSATIDAALANVKCVRFDVNQVRFCDNGNISEKSHVRDVLNGKHVFLGRSDKGFVLRTTQRDASRQKKFVIKMYRSTPGVSFEQDRAYHEFKVGCQVNKWNVSDFMVRTIGVVELNCAPLPDDDTTLICRNTSSDTATSSVPNISQKYACVIVEYVSGKSFHAHVGQMPFSKALRLLSALFQKLKPLPFTHYDMTVANLMLSEDETSLFVIDFGRSHADGVDHGPRGMYVDGDASFCIGGICPGILDNYCDFLMCINSLYGKLNVDRPKIVALLKSINKATQMRDGYMVNDSPNSLMRFIYPMAHENGSALQKYKVLLGPYDLLPAFNVRVTIPMMTTPLIDKRLEIMLDNYNYAAKTDSGRQQWYVQSSEHVWRLLISHKKWVNMTMHGFVNGVKQSRSEFIDWITSVMEEHAATSEQEERVSDKEE